MACEPGTIEASLAAALGDEPGLIAELRHAFLDGVGRCLSGLDRAEDAAAWCAAAARLKGLAASFGAFELMGLAAEALDTGCRDAGVQRRLRRAADRL